MVYLNVKHYGYKTDGKLWALFSTISANLEKEKGWGSVYPILLKELSEKSKVDLNNLDSLERELTLIYSKLSTLKIKDIYLNYDNLNEKVQCSSENLLEEPLLSYFIKTESGNNLMDTLLMAVRDAKRLKFPIEIRTM